MRRELVENIYAEFSGRVIHAVVVGALLVFLTRMLGAESYGIFALAMSLFMMSRLFSELGIDSSAARYVAEFKGEYPGTADTVVAESRRFIIATAMTVAFLLAVTADWIATLLDEPKLTPVLVVGSCYLFFYSLHVYNRQILQGYEKVTTAAKLHAVEASLTGLFVAAFVLYRPTAAFAMLGYAFGLGLVAILGFYTVNSARNSTGESTVSTSEIRLRILKYSVPLTFSNLSEVIDRQMDVLLVGYLLNPVAVAYYMLGKEISRLVAIPGASIGFALSPVYGAEKAAGQITSAASIYGESLRNVLIFYVPACTGIVLVAGVVIPSVFGAEYAGAIPVVQILALFVFFEALASISGQTLDYLGRARTRAVVNFLTSTGNFGLNLLLIPVIGVEGAAIATVITAGIYSLASVYLVYTELAFDLFPVARCLVRVSMVTLVMGVVVYALVQTFTGFLAIVLGISAGTGIWLFGCHALTLFDYRRLATNIRD